MKEQPDDTPRMSVGMHAAVTLLGTAFGILGFVLMYQVFTSAFNWKILVGMLVTGGISVDFLVGAFTGR